MKKVISKQFVQQYYKDQYQSDLCDDNGDTLAMQCVQRGIKLDKWMQHDPIIINKQGNTILALCILHHVPVQQWMLDGMDMNIQNCDGDTVAMLFLKEDYVFGDNAVPSYMKHNPNLVDKYGNTVAMLSIMNSKQPDKWMQHDKDIKTLSGDTIRDISELRDMEIESWMI